MDVFERWERDSRGGNNQLVKTKTPMNKLLKKPTEAGNFCNFCKNMGDDVHVATQILN